MRFCSKFVHDINFEERALQPCCNVHNSIVPKFPFNGYKVNMDVYTHYIEKVIDEVQMNSPHVCNGCPELVDIPHYSGIKKIMFSTLSLNHHRHLCDCRCVYCDLWKPGRHPRPFAILPPIMSLHDQGALQKNCFISWGGGQHCCRILYPQATGYMNMAIHSISIPMHCATLHGLVICLRVDKADLMSVWIQEVQLVMRV